MNELKPIDIITKFQEELKEVIEPFDENIYFEVFKEVADLKKEITNVYKVDKYTYLTLVGFILYSKVIEYRKQVKIITKELENKYDKPPKDINILAKTLFFINEELDNDSMNIINEKIIKQLINGLWLNHKNISKKTKEEILQINPNNISFIIKSLNPELLV